MTIYLTSFKRFHAAEERGGLLDFQGQRMPGYSIAVYQPKNYPRLPKLDIFDIRNEAGEWTRPRNFIRYDDTPAHNEALLRRYHDALVGMYQQRFERGGFEVEDLEKALGDDVALCCWCPYDRAAQRQLKDYGSFVCHSTVVRTFLLELGTEVILDADREKMWILDK